MNARRTQMPGKPVQRFSALVLIGAGVVLAVLAIFADELNIGGGRGFGYQQLIGLIGGIVLILWGLAIVFQRRINGRGQHRT